MKRLLVACFLVGGLAGWWGPRPGSLGPAGEASGTGGALGDESPEGAGASGTQRIRIQGDRVEVPREQLLEMLRRGSPALRIESFWLPGREFRSALWSLAQWADLDEEEVTRLDKILRESAAARKGWEATQVRVERTAPGHWRLTFPGDQGQARDELKRRLNEDFGPAKAAAIELGGDLGNFFGLQYAPEFKHGLVEVRVEKINPPADWNGEDPGLWFQTSVDGCTSELLWEDPGTSADVGIMRIVDLLGGIDSILTGMAE